MGSQTYFCALPWSFPTDRLERCEESIRYAVGQYKENVRGNMIEARLVVVGGDTEYREVSLNFPSVIGRGSDCDITLRHALVSRRHCEIDIADDLLCVRDLDSLNGTFVGKERITESELLPGQLLTVGTVTFRAVYGDWTDDCDDAYALSDLDDASSDTAKLSLDNTKLHADDDTKQTEIQGSTHALVKRARDQAGA